MQTTFSPGIATTSARHASESAWNELKTHLEEWFEAPDIQGLKVCLCALATHYYPQEKPLWILALGDSGSGKSEIIIKTFGRFPRAREIGDLSPKAFLSHYKEGKADTQQHSMLWRGGPDQIWLAKDFTSFISMRWNDRNDIARALREIWDCKYTSDKGANGTKEWKGKITMLAVATPAFERAWSAMSQLGERFMTLRWRPGNEDGAMRKARRQMGKEDWIQEVSQDLVCRILSGKRQESVIPTDDVMRRRDAIAKVVARLRVHVEREDRGNNRDIIAVPSAEFPIRISTAFSQIVRTHMDLFHKISPDQEEFDLVERLALDTIPVDTRRIMQLIPPGGEVLYSEVLKHSGIPTMTLRRRLEDLEVTGILIKHGTKEWGFRTARLAEPFASILETSKLRLCGPGTVVEMPKRTVRIGHKASFLGD
jgi:hypothetical protein